MEFEQFYHSLPKFSRFYLISVFVVTFCISYLTFLPVWYWFYLDLNKVTSNFQIWRIFTNFFIVGKFSFNFIFFMMMIYGTLTRMEKKANELKRYAEFVMLLVYTCSFLLFVSIFMTFLFGFDLKPFLTFELLFALIYIESKRDPEKIVMVWFLQVKNAYVPWVLMFFSLVTGGDIVSDLVGIAAGHLYYYLKDLAPLNNGFDLLKTPQFLNNYFNINIRNPRVASNVPFQSVNNPNASGSFSNTSANPNASTTFRTDSNEGSGNRFRPFSGRGVSWGS